MATDIPAQDSALGFGGLHPSVSPDGLSVALSYQGSIALRGEGEALRILSKGTGMDTEPAWTPDGKKIAYFSGSALKLIDVKSAQEVALPKNVNGRGRLFFHPDGKRLFGYLGQGYPVQAAWYDLGTGQVTPVILNDADDERLKAKRMQIALSPDGGSILAAIHQDEPNEQGGNRGPMADIWMANSNGENSRKLFQWPSRIHDLCWSADGKSFFAVSDLGGAHNDLWQIPLEEPLQRAKKLTSGLADEFHPSVSAKGDLLVYSDNRWGGAGVVERDLPTGSERFLPVTKIDWGEPGGNLRIRVQGESGGAEPLTARVSLKRKNGKAHAPPGALFRVTQGVFHFYTAGDRLSLPTGEYDLLAYRGPEYRPFEATVEVRAGEDTTVEIRMERWVNMAKRGWYSGENHVHANYGYGEWYNTPESMMLQCLGENLNVCNAVVANSNTDGVFDREFFLGRPDARSNPEAILYWNQEFRATLWGHMTLFNLSQLVEPVFTGFLKTTNPWDIPTNADVAQETLDQKGVVSYTHPSHNPQDLYDQPYAAKGLPVDIALGRVDAMDVMGVTYEGSTLLWYKLLNCGFRIPAAAGTDCFLNRVSSYPPGWGRVYVNLPGGLGYRKWVAELKKGRAFTSNGPMLEFSVNGVGLGGEVILPSPGKVEVVAKAESQFPLESAELVFNGKVMRQVGMDDDKLGAAFSGAVELPGSGWLAFRVKGPAGKHIVGRSLIAHTNPVYVTVEEHPMENPEDAEYFLTWIDRLDKQFRERDRVPTDRARQHVLNQLEAAREVYKNLGAGAKR